MSSFNLSSFMTKILFSCLVLRLSLCRPDNPPVNSLMQYLESNHCEAKRPDGPIGDCCCDYSTVDRATKKFFLPLLHSLTQSTFFRHFRVNLEKPCPFWEDDGVCMIKDCAVCECEASEIPEPWIVEDHNPHPFTPNPYQMTGDLFMESAEETVTSCQEQEALQQQCSHRQQGLGKLDRTRDSLSKMHKQELGGIEDGQSIYVDLTKNPEGYTGYSGPSAARVWGSIHKENCFAMVEQEQCLEKRVFYRLISGLQGSITTQIAIRYKFDENTWGYNTKLYLKGVGLYEDRLDNMYFTYIFVLRAIARATPRLLERDYNTGNPKEDKSVKEMMYTLLEGDQFSTIDGDGAKDHGECSTEVAMCRNGFNESALFKISSGKDDLLEALNTVEAVENLRQDLVAKFQNISAIMDCVGCEKCKLWGKLQTLGIGTALKILLTGDSDPVPQLTRNEIVALINTATQLAKSVRHVEIFRELEVGQKFDRLLLLSSFGTFGALILFFLLRNQVRTLKED